MHVNDQNPDDWATKAASSAYGRREAKSGWLLEQAEAKWQAEQAESKQRYQHARTQYEDRQRKDPEQGKAEGQQRRRPWPPPKHTGVDPSKSSRPTVGPSIGPSTIASRHSSPVTLKAVESLRALGAEGTSKLQSKVIIRVGTHDSERTFHVESAILCGCSSRFKSHFEKPSASFQQSKTITFPDGDPTVFEMIIEWAKRPKQRVFYAPGHYSDEPWVSNAAAAWVLGYDLAATMFTRYALSQFVQNCALVSPETWRYVEDKAPDQSSLLRFSNHWVAWNSHLYGPGVNEYSGLKAAKLADQVEGSTRDPRIFDLEHWGFDCSKSINADCTHDPIFREREREKELRRRRPPPAEWGFEYEKAGNRRH